MGNAMRKKMLQEGEGTGICEILYAVSKNLDE
jgi:hypothetical protein